MRKYKRQRKINILGTLVCDMQIPRLRPPTVTRIRGISIYSSQYGRDLHPHGMVQYIAAMSSC